MGSDLPQSLASLFQYCHSVHLNISHAVARQMPCIPSADTQQKGFFSRSIRKLESLLDKSTSNPLALDPDIATRLDAEQKQLLHMNRALLYYLSGGAIYICC